MNALCDIFKWNQQVKEELCDRGSKSFKFTTTCTSDKLSQPCMYFNYKIKELVEILIYRHLATILLVFKKVAGLLLFLSIRLY